MYLYSFNMGPKFVRKPKGLSVFKNRVLTKSVAEKENNRATIYNQKFHIFLHFASYYDLKRTEFIRPSTKYRRPLSRYLSYASLRLLR